MNRWLVRVSGNQFQIRMRSKITYWKAIFPKQLYNPKGAPLGKDWLSSPYSSRTVSSNHTDFWSLHISTPGPLLPTLFLFWEHFWFFFNFWYCLKCHLLRETFLNHLSEIGFSKHLLVSFATLIVIDGHLFCWLISVSPTRFLAPWN